MSAAPRPVAVVFCKAPVPGRLKTRLSPYFEPDEAAAIGLAMLLDVLEAVASQRWQTVASVAHRQDLAAVASLLPDGVQVSVQPTGDLGARMARELKRYGADSGRPVAIIGSDCPGISRAHVGTAFDALDDGAQAAICPSDDGGYSLLAARGDITPLLSDIPWSTAEVARTTKAAAQVHGIRLEVCTPLPDVDTADDLAHLFGAASQRDPVACRTRAVAVALKNKRQGLAFAPGECQGTPL